MLKTQNIISFNQIQIFLLLFNRDGYVLNFSTPDFDRFTYNSIGVSLCERYGLSKGKSLEAFCDEGEEIQVIKLFRDLLEYYENVCQYEIDVNDPKYSRMFANLYIKCKEILKNLPYNNTHVILSVEKIKARFSSEYLECQINFMVEMIEENPTEAIGKAKEFIETCCKNILNNEGVEFSIGADVNKLIKLTMKVLNIHVDCIDNSKPEAVIIKSILGSLSNIVSNLAELRNSYGSGHGKDIDYRGLTSRHANLAVGASVSLVRYLWDTYEWRRKTNND